MLGAAMTASGAKAHDFSASFDTRAQCETAWADSNKIDRDFLRELNPELFQTKGDVMHTSRSTSAVSMIPSKTNGTSRTIARALDLAGM